MDKIGNFIKIIYLIQDLSLVLKTIYLYIYIIYCYRSQNRFKNSKIDFYSCKNNITTQITENIRE